MTTQQQFRFLDAENGPAILREYKKLYGTAEWGGTSVELSNPVIIGWAKELGLQNVYTGDDTAWCGLAAAYAVHRAGYPVVKDPLRAINWLNFGVKVPYPEFGDMVVLSRVGGNHVATYVGETKDSFYLLGGNQSNKVGIGSFSKQLFLGARRPAYKVKPLNVRRVVFDNNGNMIAGRQVLPKLAVPVVGAVLVITAGLLLYQYATKH